VLVAGLVWVLASAERRMAAASDPRQPPPARIIYYRW
jgi:hypothetical protein